MGLKIQDTSINSTHPAKTHNIQFF